MVVLMTIVYTVERKLYYKRFVIIQLKEKEKKIVELY